MRRIIYYTIFLPTLLLAGTTGKIAGRVVNTETGEPLPFVNVYLIDANLGGVTDEDGYYFILGIPPGYYDVKAEMMGFQVVIQEGALIVSDRTTPLNFSLNPTILDIGKEVIVIGERPLIEFDRTSKISVITDKEIEKGPLHTISEILASQAGVTLGSGQEIHVRGGRSGELAYMIDGMSVRDPLFGGFKSFLPSSSISEMVLLSGTFNAEYGDAMSGVVNIVTKSGGVKFNGDIGYSSINIAGFRYRKKDAFAEYEVEDKYEYIRQDLRDYYDVVAPGSFEGYLSSGIPGLRNTTLFTAGKYIAENSYLPFGYSLERNIIAKITTRLENFNIFLSIQGGDNYYQNYSHSWKYRYDHYPRGKRFMHREAISIRYAPNERVFYSLGFSNFSRDNLLRVDDKEPEDYEAGIATDLEFYTEGGGDYPLYRDSKTGSISLNSSLTIQLNNRHQFKAGVEVKRCDLYLHQMSRMVVGGPYQFQEFQHYPVEAAAYLQDKMEYDYMVLNAGIRFDYADPRTDMWSDIRDPESEVVRVDKKMQFSPRIGLAHPVTDRTVLHFAYGHFFQNPSYYCQYTNLHYLDPDSLINNVIIGNPSIEAQKTVAYEVGLQQKLSESFAFYITAFYKDMTNMVTTRSIRWSGIDYFVYDNEDYGNSKGIDLTLKGRIVDIIYTSFNYTFSVARGNRSSPMEGFWNAYTGRPEAMTEYYLGFDRTHDIAFSLSIEYPESYRIRWLANTSFNLLIEASSGLPYTPYVGPGLYVEQNSARMAWTSEVNLRVEKEMLIFKGISSRLFIEGTNLLDHLNPLYVYSRTGDPWDPGWGGLGTSPDAVYDPRNVGKRREVRCGFKIFW
ncbi:TonB-dependent receptor [candidate division WOR-3 bacterium]|nr:TonB-dependent receptor [candidate division WOR-3 bacterium]